LALSEFERFVPPLFPVSCLHESMATDSITWQGVLIRLFVSLVLVFLTWNAEGWSYYH